MQSACVLLVNNAAKLKRVIFQLLLFSAFVMQGQTIKIAFHVYNESNSSPVQYCYVLVQGKNASVMSDDSGFASISALTSDTIVVYQAGFKLKKMLASDIKPKVLLSPKDIQLSEVVIKARSIEKFHEQNNTVYLEFEFYDDFLLCIVNKGKINSLQLLDIRGNIVSELVLPAGSDRLHKDCFDNVHVISSDSIYQVYYDYSALGLLKAFSFVKYFSLLSACECSYGNSYIFKMKHYRDLKNTYCFYDEKIPGKSRFIACASDSLAIDGFNLDFNLNFFLNERRKGAGYMTSVSEIQKHLDQYRESIILSDRYSNLLRPVESEMKRVDTNFFLVDYTNKTIQKFSLHGELQTKTFLMHFEKINSRMYLDDDAKFIVYTSMSKSGKLTLFRFDPLKVNFTHEFSISNYPFINKFRIKGNHIYFLNKSKIVKMYIAWKPL